QIMAFMTDNASNNNTLIDGIVDRAKNQDISMNADWVCLCCMPHTVHLAALKLVEGIGAISAAESKKAMFQSGNYQNSVITPVNHAFDNDVVGRDDEDMQDEISPEYDRSENIFLPSKR
ncbi:hypothetical protein BGY98DRAFT_917106, partial [Russula aff. rugulosa BPL654]